jgi:hypothetical protein
MYLEKDWEEMAFQYHRSGRSSKKVIGSGKLSHCKYPVPEDFFLFRSA